VPPGAYDVRIKRWGFASPSSLSSIRRQSESGYFPFDLSHLNTTQLFLQWYATIFETDAMVSAMVSAMVFS
jgi:hypothetical protein